MQNLLFIIFSLIFSTAIAQNQPEDTLNYKAIYQLTYYPDSTRINNKKSEQFYLYIGNGLSFFASEGRIMKDSLSIKIPAGGAGNIDFAERASRTKTDFDYVIYKGFPEEKISYNLKIIRDNFRYEEDLNQFTWEILPETKEIQGYKAQKARTSFAGRNYTAWFTTEIPISDGPYKFNGLPGLILQVKDDKGHYTFELIGFENFDNPVAFEIKEADFIKTDKRKLLELQKEFALNPFAVLERSNTATKKVTINFKDGQKEELLKKSREEYERKNNPIELE